MNEIEVSTTGSYIVVPVNVWYDKSTKRIHLTTPASKKFHTDVQPGSSQHRQFKKLLEDAGKWPEGVD